MAARRRIQGRAQTVGGRTNWSRLVPTTSTVVAAGTKIVLTTFVLDNPGISETVRRTRGRFFFASDQGSSTEEVHGAWGAVVVTDAAAAAGVASMPGPVTDASDDNWFVWEPFGNMLANVATGNIAATNEPLVDFDSKAMRKVATGFQLAFIVENSSGSTGFRICVALSLLSSRG